MVLLDFIRIYAPGFFWVYDICMVEILQDGRLSCMVWVHAPEVYSPEHHIYKLSDVPVFCAACESIASSPVMCPDACHRTDGHSLSEGHQKCFLSYVLLYQAHDHFQAASGFPGFSRQMWL